MNKSSCKTTPVQNRKEILDIFEQRYLTKYVIPTYEMLNSHS